MSKKAVNSTHSKTLIPIVAEKLGISIEMAQDVINDYYDRAVKDIENMNKRSIFLRKLGTLTFSMKKIERVIKMNEQSAENKGNDGESFKHVVIKRQLFEKNDFLQSKLLKFKQEDEKLNQDLERKIKDFRGDQE